MISEFFKSRIASFANAISGVMICLQSETNARIHLGMTLLVLGCAALFNVSRFEWMILIFLIGLVWTAELFNTAIEKTADRITNNFDPQIKQIKDLAAGAVLVMSVSSAAVGLLIFFPRIIHALQGIFLR